MRKLIVVRHGQYSHDPILGFGLSKEGVAQIELIAARLANEAFATAKVIACDTPRAEQSGEIIARKLGVELVVSASLDASSHEAYDENKFEMVREIAAMGADVDTLIIVNHLPMLMKLPNDFGREVLGAEFPVYEFRDDQDKEVQPPGSAVVIDCVAKTCELIRLEAA